jgi:GNAT superfamily N-acetyltransferase
MTEESGPAGTDAVGDRAEVTVRRATEEDLNRIVLFNQAMAREAEGRELDRARLEKGVAAVLEDPDPGRAVYFLAEKDGEAVGQIAVTREWSDWRNAYIWWIQNVYVSKLHRREGIYRVLHGHVRDRALEAGAAGLRLMVDRDNHPARETYESLGMRRSHYMMFAEMWK